MAAELVKLYTAVDKALKMNLQGITDEESAKCVANCNSINWLVGHIVVSRNKTLELLGLPPIAPEAIKPAYERGSKMLTDHKKAEKLSALVNLFHEAQGKIIEAVKGTLNVELAEKLTFAGFHEAYHVGQVAMARKLLGKEGAIK